MGASMARRKSAFLEREKARLMEHQGTRLREESEHELHRERSKSALLAMEKSRLVAQQETRLAEEKRKSILEEIALLEARKAEVHDLKLSVDGSALELPNLVGETPSPAPSSPFPDRHRDVKEKKGVPGFPELVPRPRSRKHSRKH